jgi:hypothetical protein
MSISGDITWNEKLEHYFSSTGEKANCLSIVHKKCEEKYSYLRSFIDLPVIVISSLTGFFSVGSSTMFEGHEQSASIALGIASLLVSVLNTTGSYFSWSKRAEGHRISAIQYARLYRFLQIEMSLPRDERQTPSDLLKYTKEAYDRLQEISPLVPPGILREYADKFSKYKDISLPEEMNGLTAIEIFQESESFRIENPLRNQNALRDSSLQIRVPSLQRERETPLQTPADIAERQRPVDSRQHLVSSERTQDEGKSDADGGRRDGV